MRKFLENRSIAWLARMTAITVFLLGLAMMAEPDTSLAQEIGVDGTPSPFPIWADGLPDVFLPMIFGSGTQSGSPTPTTPPPGPTPTLPPPVLGNYVVSGWNDLGMHGLPPDSSSYRRPTSLTACNQYFAKRFKAESPGA